MLEQVSKHTFPGMLVLALVVRKKPSFLRTLSWEVIMKSHMQSATPTSWHWQGGLLQLGQ